MMAYGGYGGATATLFVDDSEISGNDADGDGGGIYNDNDHVEIFNGSVIADNIAGGNGGGVYTFGNGFTDRRITVCQQQPDSRQYRWR